MMLARFLGRTLKPAACGRGYCSLASRVEQLEHELAQLREDSLHLDDLIELDQLSFDQLTKQRNSKYFSAGQKKMVDLVSLQHGASPVGSFKYLAMAFPGDMDLFEQLTWPCTKEEASYRAAKRIQNMAARISLEPSCFIADFKCGYDARLMFPIASSVAEHDPAGVGERLKGAASEGLISIDQLKVLSGLSEKGISCQDSLTQLREQVRLLYTLRWRLGELLTGSKTLVDGSQLLLPQAIQEHQSVVKVDCWGLTVDDHGYEKWMEVTNYFDMWHDEHYNWDDETPRIAPTQMTKPWDCSYIEALNGDVNKYYGTNSMKAAKRLWMRAVLVKDVDMLRAIYPLFSSPAAALSQVSAEAETLCDMVSALGARQGMLLKVLDPVLAQVMGFSKRIKSNLASESISDQGLRPKATRFLFDQVKGLQVELVHRNGLRDATDHLLEPIFFEAKSLLADEGIHGGYVSNTFIKNLVELRIELDKVVEVYSHRYLQSLSKDMVDQHDRLCKQS